MINLENTRVLSIPNYAIVNVISIWTQIDL